MYKNPGASSELMPSIMGAFDAFMENSREEPPKSTTPKRSFQLGNFANLSPCVQKILANVPEQEINKRFNSEESLGLKRTLTKTSVYRSLRSCDRNNRYKSNESLDIISPNVQKMLSNFPETDLVIGERKMFYAKVENVCSECVRTNDDSEFSPLGSYQQNTHGIASRMPVGRKNLGKFLQVPSESSVGTNSTTSSEVSRPVSLTSLGSCSSSGSSGPHQPSSAYLASAESLDSDPEPTGSQGSADSGIAEQIIMSPEARVLQEVLDTETVYVADLNEVIQGYLEPWRSDYDCPLQPHLADLFSNIEEIYNFNKSFLHQLHDADFNLTKIANVFIQSNANFTVYNEYCTNYPRTMEVLSALTKDEAIAALFRQKQAGLNHALPLGSYLLKPVQRILKYHLLLQRLSKQCDPSHKPAVDLALTTMTSVASNINNMKRKHEHAVRVHEIQSQLYGWSGPDLTTLGELIAEGTFRVSGARGRRQVFLFDKIFLMAKNKQDGALAYKSHVECSNLMLVEKVRGEPLSFQVLPFDNPRLQCTLRARSPQNKREWTLQIKRVILENYSAVIPNHARQLVLQLGQDLQETEDTDKWSLNKSLTPHYLERRSRVRKSRDYRRSSSQDRSFPLGSWRRKSEPSMALIPQYTSKTIPKKISKIKKAKETGAKFYTDLSDSDMGKSSESLLVEAGEKLPEQSTPLDTNLEKIVSDLLMQNQEFHKVMNRQRRNVRGSEPEPVWFEDRPKLPNKADSLPRSFQLNDQIEKDCQKPVLDESLEENPDDEQHENDLASQADDSEYPEHKIYRKTAIRFSLIQRFRTMVSEEQKKISKYQVRKQGSKSMGEKIAHPDYADPQKLFPTSSSLSIEVPECDLSEPEALDLSLSEKDVLKEFEKRLNSTNLDTGQDESFSSQNSEGYYESILENSLVEEYTKDEHGKLVAKQDSFKNNENIYLEKFRELKTDERAIKRPNKPPPPIPSKPSRLVRNIIPTQTIKENCEKSWVKAMVVRFE